MPLEVMSLFLLCGLLLFQQCFYLRQINLLINKLMSRNYQEYALVDKPKDSKRDKIQIVSEPAEDLRVLEGFSPI